MIALICAAALIWQSHKDKATEQKLAEDARAYRVRAEQGDAKAESILAYMYSHGQGVPQDYDEALRWRRKAADQGYADGEVGLGYMYWHGQGVPQDYTETLRWFHKAADQGDAKAQYNLAIMYSQGDGVQQDYDEAVRRYRIAAGEGYAPAQYGLGEMYYYGHGVPRDLAEAVRWYQKAADQGDEYAQQVLHIKWKGMSKIRKITLSTMFLGNVLILIGAVKDWGSSQGAQQRTFALATLFGFSYLALDLLGFRYIGILTPQLLVGAFQLVESLLGGTSLAILLSVVLPIKLWPKVAKILLGLNGVLLIGLEASMLSIYRLRHLVPTLRSFWSINGRLLGTLVALAIVLWWTSKTRRDGQTEAAELQPPIPEPPQEP